MERGAKKLVNKKNQGQALKSFTRWESNTRLLGKIERQKKKTEHLESDEHKAVGIKATHLLFA